MGGNQRQLIYHFSLCTVLLMLFSIILTPMDVDASTLSQSYYVASNGSDANSCTQSAPCRTIQKAVNQAESGDTILVAQGTYTYDGSHDPCIDPLGTTGVICVVNKQLTISGGYTTNNWSSANPSANLTTIDGQGAYRGLLAIKTDNTTTLAMSGFTIQNGLAAGIAKRPGNDKIFGFGGGIFVDSIEQISLQNMTLQSNNAIGNDTTASQDGVDYGGAGSGGGLAIRGTEMAIMNNVRFINNRVQGGSGQTRGGYGIGGGLYSYQSTITGNNLFFEQNSATAGSSSGSGKTSDGERADAFGGAASFQEGSQIRLENVEAIGNQATGGNATTDAGGAFGGAFKAEQAVVSITNAKIHQNLAQGGNGQNGWLGNGGGLEAIDSSLTLNRLFVMENRAIGGNGTSGDKGAAGGGGINSTWITGGHSAHLTLSNSVIAGNSVESGAGTNVTGGGGGGLWIQATEATVEHATIADNQIDNAMQGQGILLIEVGNRNATANINYSIIANHTGGSSHAALHVKPGNSVQLTRGLWSNNATNSNIGGTPGPVGTISGQNSMNSGSAGFVSSGRPNYNYSLTETSDAIDQATGSVSTTDITGFSRNSTPDIGAYEALPSLTNFVYLPAITR